MGSGVSVGINNNTLKWAEIHIIARKELAVTVLATVMMRIINT